MATTAELTAQYQRQAQTLKAAALRDVLRVWPAFDPDNFDGSWPPLRRALEMLVGDHRAQVAQLAANYLRAVNLLEFRSGDIDVLQATEIDPLALRTSLQVTGPIAAKEAVSAGAAAEVAADRALVKVSGVVTRAVLNGGRETIMRSMWSGGRAFMRVTHGKTCWFCSMLASRGPVYRSAASGGDPRGRPGRFHDHCDCTLEPVFTPRQAIPDRTVELADLWASSTVGARDGAAARAAFRAAYESTL